MVSSPTDQHTLTLKGILINNQVNKNNWSISEEDFETVAKSFIGVQLRTDHTEKVSSVLGKVISTEVDSSHEEDKNEWDHANPHPHIHFQANITTQDNNILIPIKMGYVDSISPAIDAKTLLCSSCKKPMIDKHVKSCKCTDGGVLLKDLSAREVSIVCSPAYEGTTIKVYDFAAAVDNSFLSEDKILSIVEDELSKRGI